MIWLRYHRVDVAPLGHAGQVFFLVTVIGLAAWFLWWVQRKPTMAEEHVRDCTLFLHLNPFEEKLREWVAERPAVTETFKLWEGDHPNCTVEINGAIAFNGDRMLWEGQVRAGTDLSQALCICGSQAEAFDGLYLSPVHAKPEFTTFTAVFRLPQRIEVAP